MIRFAAGMFIAVLVSCSMPAPPAPATSTARCPLLPEPPTTPTRAYLLLLISMYKDCASRP